jgi:hypothetical protein
LDAVAAAEEQQSVVCAARFGAYDPGGFRCDRVRRKFNAYNNVYNNTNSNNISGQDHWDSRFGSTIGDL